MPHLFIRYFLLVTVATGFLGVSKEKEMWVQIADKPNEVNPPIKMEVGVLRMPCTLNLSSQTRGLSFSCPFFSFSFSFSFFFFFFF